MASNWSHSLTAHKNTAITNRESPCHLLPVKKSMLHFRISRNCLSYLCLMVLFFRIVYRWNRKIQESLRWSRISQAIRRIHGRDARPKVSRGDGAIHQPIRRREWSARGEGANQVTTNTAAAFVSFLDAIVLNEYCTVCGLRSVYTLDQFRSLSPRLTKYWKIRTKSYS